MTTLELAFSRFNLLDPIKLDPIWIQIGSSVKFAVWALETPPGNPNSASLHTEIIPSVYLLRKATHATALRRVEPRWANIISSLGQRRDSECLTAINT